MNKNPTLTHGVSSPDTGIYMRPKSLRWLEYLAQDIQDRKVQRLSGETELSIQGVFIKLKSALSIRQIRAINALRIITKHNLMRKPLNPVLTKALVNVMATCVIEAETSPQIALQLCPALVTFIIYGYLGQPVSKPDQNEEKFKQVCIDTFSHLSDAKQLTNQEIFTATAHIVQLVKHGFIDFLPRIPCSVLINLLNKLSFPSTTDNLDDYISTLEALSLFATLRLLPKSGFSDLSTMTRMLNSYSVIAGLIEQLAEVKDLPLPGINTSLTVINALLRTGYIHPIHTESSFLPKVLTLLTRMINQIGAPIDEENLIPMVYLIAYWSDLLELLGSSLVSRYPVVLVCQDRIGELYEHISRSQLNEAYHSTATRSLIKLQKYGYHQSSSLREEKIKTPIIEEQEIPFLSSFTSHSLMPQKKPIHTYNPFDILRETPEPGTVLSSNSTATSGIAGVKPPLISSHQPTLRRRDKSAQKKINRKYRGRRKQPASMPIQVKKPLVVKAKPITTALEERKLNTTAPLPDVYRPEVAMNAVLAGLFFKCQRYMEAAGYWEKFMVSLNPYKPFDVKTSELVKCIQNMIFTLMDFHQHPPTFLQQDIQVRHEVLVLFARQFYGDQSTKKEWLVASMKVIGLNQNQLPWEESRIKFSDDVATLLNCETVSLPASYSKIRLAIAEAFHEFTKIDFEKENSEDLSRIFGKVGIAFLQQGPAESLSAKRYLKSALRFNPKNQAARDAFEWLVRNEDELIQQAATNKMELKYDLPIEEQKESSPSSQKENRCTRFTHFLYTFFKLPSIPVSVSEKSEQILKIVRGINSK
jgi:hypothetical protein